MTTVLDRNVAVKVIGASGQISLGKEYAGKQVLIEEKEPGVWLVRTASSFRRMRCGCMAPRQAVIFRKQWLGLWATRRRKATRTIF